MRRLLGSVEMDVDWGLPVPEMREELRRALERSDLWDGRVSVLQVTDAVGTAMRIRALVSASDAPRLWDLRCIIREHLVGWVRDHHPASLPHLREEITSPTTVFAEAAVQTTVDAVRQSREDQRVFGNSADGRARGDAFVGPQGLDAQPPHPERPPGSEPTGAP